MFSGSFVALVTPFKENLDVDFEAYGRLVDYHLESGTHGLVPCGCTGEAATLSHDEQIECIRFVVERVAGKVPVIGGAGSNNTREAEHLTKRARDAGCDGILSITPYYNKPIPEGQIAHYTQVAKAAGDLPVMLYNVPGRTGTKMSPETIAELSKIDNIKSVKEACGSVDQVSQILQLCDITVVSGDDSLTLPMISVGAVGVVSVSANVAPAKMAKLCDAANQNEYATARQVHHRLMPLFKALFTETNPIPVKATLAKMGLIENNLRLPLTPMRPESFAQIESIVEQIVEQPAGVSA